MPDPDLIMLTPRLDVEIKGMKAQVAKMLVVHAKDLEAIVERSMLEALSDGAVAAMIRAEVTKSLRELIEQAVREAIVYQSSRGESNLRETIRKAAEQSVNHFVYEEKRRQAEWEQWQREQGNS